MTSMLNLVRSGQTRLAIVSLLTLAGCAASTAPSLSGVGDHGANTGLEALIAQNSAEPAAAPAIIEPTAEARPERVSPPRTAPFALSEVFDRAAPVSKPIAKTAPRSPKTVASADLESLVSIEAFAGLPSDEGPALSALEPDDEHSDSAEPAPQPAPGAEPSPESRFKDAARVIRATLAAQPAADRDELAGAIKLAVFDAIAGPSPDQGPSRPSSLAPPQTAVVRAIGSLINRLTSSPGEIDDPNAAIAALDAAAAEMTQAQSVRIASAKLCTKVTGFGQYTPVRSNLLQAGRAHRAIVYVELANFAHRDVRDGDPAAALRTDDPSTSTADRMWAVEISQELGLWHASDGSLQWRRPEQTLTEISRNRRRDFYLVQTVDLPATLSVGEYSLKVVVRDRTTNSVDEAIVPITVVADASVSSVSK